jgi:NADPH:quinone reductase
VRAVVIDGGALTVVERPTPPPADGEVLVRVVSAGLNAADLHQRRGLYPAPAGWPADVPGLEIAGVVDAVGPSVLTAAPGDRVCAVVGGGGQATHCLVPASHLLPVPSSVDLATAGGFPEAHLTAFDALVRNAGLRRGERVLVTGAAGGVGTAAVQVAATMGGVVTAVVRDDRHRDRLVELGASEVVVADGLDGLEPVDVVIELVGAAMLERYQSRLASHARVVVIGVSGGSTSQVDLLQMMARRSHLTGSTLRSRAPREKAELAADAARELVPMWAEERLTVPLAATFAIDEVDAAYRAFALPGKLGKIVLVAGAAD